jgi:hypothetical protein
MDSKCSATCSVGPRFFLSLRKNFKLRGRTADLQNRSALRSFRARPPNDGLTGGSRTGSTAILDHALLLLLPRNNF